MGTSTMTHVLCISRVWERREASSDGARSSATAEYALALLLLALGARLDGLGVY